MPDDPAPTDSAPQAPGDPQDTSAPPGPRLGTFNVEIKEGRTDNEEKRA